jgi:hypothetical protein
MGLGETVPLPPVPLLSPGSKSLSGVLLAGVWVKVGVWVGEIVTFGLAASF